MRPLVRLLLTLPLLAGLLSGVLAPGSAHALDRTLVIRGRAVDQAGAPLAGARISARGSATLTATTDALGRYVLRTVIGSPASLARAPFTLEVRAEYDGRRLPFAIQGSAFALDVSMVRGNRAVARIRSNAPSAALAVAAAFVSNIAAEAVVEVEFGGSGPSGAPRLSAVEEVPVPDAPGGMGSGDSSNPAPPRTTAVSKPTSAGPAPPTALRTAPTPPRVASTFAQRDSVRNAASAEAARVRRARADSLARLRDAARKRDSAPRTQPGATRPLAPSVTLSARSADTLRTLLLVVDVDSTAVPALDGPARVQRIDPFSAPAARSIEPDTCACRLRGTVEVDWDRPLEQDLPVEIVLTGPASQRAEVELFIGSPREFHMGPLPCGTYRLEVRPGGRLRYALARGDSRIECRGSAQVRVVLTPVRR